MKKTWLLFFIIHFSFLAFTEILNGKDQEKGLLIAKKAYECRSGFGSFTVDMKMELIASTGHKAIREIQLYTLEVPNDGNKNLLVFKNPKDINGTSLLSYTHKVGDDDQWIYLPALKRVKRISSNNKSGSFMGSEFSYEDISNQEVEKYAYSFIKDEELNGIECYVIESYPKDKISSGYTKQVTWIDKDEYRSWRIDYYDRKNELLKTLTFSGHQKYFTRFWRPTKMVMVNHQNQKSTELVFSKYNFKSELKDAFFSKRKLAKR